MLWQVIKLSASRFYDHLGKCIWINLVWFFVSLTVVLLPPATAALFFYLNEAVRFEDPDTRCFFQALRRFFLRAWGLFVAQLLIIGGLSAGIIIYITQLSEVIGRLAMILAALCIWMLVYFIGILGYMWSFMVYQDVGIWTAAKRAAVLFVMRPVSTMVLLVISLVLFGLNLPFRFLPITFFQMALVAVMWNVAVIVALEEVPD